MQQADEDALNALEEHEQCRPCNGESKVRIAFNCSMLMTKTQSGPGGGAGKRWRDMSCEDPDDFETLKERVWTVEDFREGDYVELWPRECVGPPSKTGERRVRTGRVKELVNQDGEVDPDPSLTIARRTRKQEQERRARSLL